MIRTPDQRLRVFVSSTLEELRDERDAARRAIESLRLTPVMFELGARPHAPRALYRAYLEQSDVFVGIYWQRYGWVAPDMEISGLEDELELSRGMPRLLYLKHPAHPDSGLRRMLDRVRDEAEVSFKRFGDVAELERLVADDLALLLSESFGPFGHRAARGETVLASRLPVAPTPFVGRVADAATLVSMLAGPDLRLVSLTGPGGIGKTRLALEVAQRAQDHFRDRAAFVPLASVRDERLVPAAVMEALGLRDPGVADPGRALAALLAERELLLVLDNFEQVVGAAGVVADVLAAAPGIKVLVTSREALRLQGEHEYRVRPLAVPSAHANAEEVRASDAAVLFEQRARARLVGFRIDDANAAVIAAVCRRLEGVPLAIELAAARANLYSPAALLARLDGGLTSLGGGGRDLPKRQQALRATLDWSYELLDGSEQRLLAVLSVFTGGFDLAAAEEVTGLAERATDGLASLVDKSLLDVVAGDIEVRFRMLEMVRQYASDKLDALPEAHDARDRHAARYHRLAVEAGEGVRLADHQRWLKLLTGAAGEGDADNLRTALRWLVSTGQLDDVAEIMWAIFPCLWLTGRFDEARWFIERVLSTRTPMQSRSRGRCLAIAAMANLWLGSPEVAMERLGEADAAAASTGDAEALAFVRLLQGFVHGVIGDLAAAESAIDESLRYARANGDRWSEANALNTFGWLFVLHEQHEGRSAVFESALEASQALGDPFAVSTAEWQLAEHAIAAGDLARAGRLLSTSLQAMRDLQVVHLLPYVIDSTARLATALHRHEAAVELLAAAERIREVTDVPIWGPARDRRDRLAESLRAELGSAVDEAWRRGRELRSTEAAAAACAIAASATEAYGSGFDAGGVR